jgi:MFS family permease
MMLGKGKMKAETVTLILVNLAGIMERADESLLPGVYREVGAALHTGPTGLGSLTLFRSIVQSACYPVAAYLAMRHNRAHVIALGAFLWAAATFLVAFSSTFFQVRNSKKEIICTPTCPFFIGFFFFGNPCLVAKNSLIKKLFPFSCR